MESKAGKKKKTGLELGLLGQIISPPKPQCSDLKNGAQ